MRGKKYVGLCATAIAVIGVTACGGQGSETSTNSSKSQGGDIVMSNAGGLLGEAYKAAFVTPYQRETGAKFTYDEDPGDQGPKLEAQSAAGKVQWDLVGGYSYDTYLNLANKGLLRPIDFKKLGPNANKLPADAKAPWGIAPEYDTYALAYNTKKFKGNEPTKLADFFDTKKYPGRRGVPNTGDTTVALALALLADGVPPEQLVPLDVNRALKKYDTIKDSVNLFYGTGTEMAEALVNNRIDMCLCLDGRVFQALRANPDWKVVWQDAIRKPAFVAATKKGPNSQNAEAFLKYFLDPQLAAQWTSIIGYSGPLLASYKYLTPAVKDFVMANPKNFKETVALSHAQLEQVAPKLDQINQQWNDWVSK